MAPPPETTDRPLAAIVLLVAAMAVVPGMDACAKYLSRDFTVWQVTWARYFFHFAAILPLVVWHQRRRAQGFQWPQKMGLQLLRSGFLFVSTLFFFAALARMPMADALALIFVSPLIITALSPWLLGETVGARRWGAVIVGFMGTCIIIRPDFSGGWGLFDTGTAFALAAGACYALYVLFTRKLSGSAPPLITLAFTSITGAVAMSVVMPFVWQHPDVRAWLVMVLMGVIGAVAHFMVILAYERAPASLLAPFGFSEIVTATLLGFVIFGNFPAPLTWLGIAIVISCGIYISLREARKRPARKTAKEGPAQPL